MIQQEGLEKTGNNSKDEDDTLLGKVVPNLLISQFQKEKLRSTVASRLSVGYIHKADVYYTPVRSKDHSSSLEFHHKGKVYKVTIDIADVSAP